MVLANFTLWVLPYLVCFPLASSYLNICVCMCASLCACVVCVCVCVYVPVSVCVCICVCAPFSAVLPCIQCYFSEQNVASIVWASLLCPLSCAILNAALIMSLFIVLPTCMLSLPFQPGHLHQFEQFRCQPWTRSWSPSRNLSLFQIFKVSALNSVMESIKESITLSNI